MTYEAWRISFQSSEAAARSAYAELTLSAQQLDSAVKALQGIRVLTLETIVEAEIDEALARIKQMKGGGCVEKQN